MSRKHILSRFLAMVLLLSLLAPVISRPVFAAAAEKTVRVGYMLYDGYQEGGEGEVKSGSAYEYFQKIRYYTGWNYEYVYGNISQLLTMLEAGEIDIMAILTKTGERTEKFLFSQEPHGSESFYLYVHQDENTITVNDPASLAGKTFGAVHGSYQETYLRKWCEEMGIPCKIVTYALSEDLHQALSSGKIDVMIQVRILEQDPATAPWKSVHRFPSNNLYFAVNKERPDILAQLDEAMANIILTDEFFASDLMKKYHEGTNHVNAFLTESQRAYVDSCGILKVGYLTDTKPVSFTEEDTGGIGGIAGEYLSIMEQTYGLRFEAIPYPNEQSLLQGMQDGLLDIIVPLGLGYWEAESLEIALSTPMVSLPMSAVYKFTGTQDTFRRVAVIQGSVTQESYVKKHYPDLDILYVKDTEAALQAISQGWADCYFVRSDYIDYMRREYPLISRFHTASLTYSRDIYMATTIEDTLLTAILDKGLSLMTDTQIDAAKLRYAYEQQDTSLWQAIVDNWIIVLAITVTVLLIMAILAVLYRLKLNTAYMRDLREEKEKADQARRAKTDFLFQMSHDIRTPMNAIIGFTNFAKTSEDLETIHNDYIPKIETASHQLLMLINDALEMSRIESGKLVFNRVVTNVQTIVENVVTVMRSQAEEKNILLTTEISTKNPVVFCDQNHLSRVIMNLLSNAVKFTPSGGKVHLSLHQKENAPDGRSAFRLKIADTGIGMSPEFLERVFEPFEREQSSTVSGLQGTGLGLAIVKRIIETAGDTITVESEKGRGTVFTLDLTLRNRIPEEEDRQSAAGGTPSRQDLSEYFSGKRLLLVEDNEFNLMIAQTVLESAGFLVETAGDGQAAVDQVIRASGPDYYDAILMDIQMPVMNGYDATRTIRTLADRRSRVKIIALTANAFDTDKADAAAAGMDGHIAKPIDIDDLYRTLWEILHIHKE